MSLSHLYNTTMDVYEVDTDTQSDTGGVEESEILIHGNVACLIEISRGGEREILGKEGVSITHIIYCDLITIVEKNRVKIGTQTYDVDRVDNVQGKGHHMEIEVIERR